ncbi:phage tail protein [Facklamia sp. P9177]|uniref:phage tail protein n=1 Tax=Facklamia sp. P9177 TaxID=3421945 RepID=UPI003D17B5C9
MLDVFFDEIVLSHHNLCLVERPFIPTTEREVVHHDNVDLLDGGLTEFGALKNRQLTLNVNILEENLKPKLREFKGAFLNKRSFNMIFGDDPEFYHRVKSAKIGDIENEFYQKGAFNIDMVLDPFEYYKYLNITKGINLVEVNNRGTYHALPIIKIKGIGDVVLKVNDLSMTIEGMLDEMVIDCEKLDYYNPLTPNSSAEKIHTKSFPVLPIGKNIITTQGNVTSIEVEFKERFL